MALTEEELLTLLEADPVPAEELVEEFDALAADGKEVRALEWADVAKDALMYRKLFDEAIVVYEWAALRQETSIAAAQKALLDMFNANRKEQKFIEPAFAKASSTEEAFSRLKHLRTLKKGKLCYSKTWGFGVVSRVDPFYQKLEVTFEKKGEHELAFSYAAAALDVLTEDHLLAIRHNRPDEFLRLLKENPAEVIRITLRSYGPQPITGIQDHFVPDILATEAEWKKFWDTARRDLKNDPLVEIPAKRTDPLRLRRKAKSYNEAWFDKFKNERDVPSLFSKFDEIQNQQFPAFEPFMQDAIADRLGFAIKGGTLNQPGWIARALVYSGQFHIEPAGVDHLAELKKLAECEELPVLLEELPARFVHAFINLLFTATEAAKGVLLRRLPELGFAALNETMEVLIRSGAGEELSGRIRDTVRKRECTPALLLWILRNEDRTAGWNLTDRADLALQTVELIEQEHSGAALRAQNQLREQIENTAVLKTVLAEMNDSQRRDFMRRISESPVWSKLDRQSLQAKMIKLSPDLHEVVLKKNSGTAPKEKKKRITSYRTYNQRKHHFEVILKKEILENSREIELARSYGDLRENAEYKYAKEKQRLLGLQAEELQNALDEVRPTDFAGFPADAAGIATGVELAYAGGRRETWFILGEWDQNEPLGIISCQTGMAQALIGKKPGSCVTVPSAEKETVEAEIIAVTPLPEHIKEWINGTGYGNASRVDSDRI
ncbi:MAG: GreA/GreB family elongation factor [Kiritimatiellales bacterium]